MTIHRLHEIAAENRKYTTHFIDISVDREKKSKKILAKLNKLSTRIGITKSHLLQYNPILDRWEYVDVRLARSAEVGHWYTQFWNTLTVKEMQEYNAGRIFFYSF